MTTLTTHRLVAAHATALHSCTRCHPPRLEIGSCDRRNFRALAKCKVRCGSVIRFGYKLMSVWLLHHVHYCCVSAYSTRRKTTRETAEHPCTRQGMGWNDI